VHPSLSGAPAAVQAAAKQVLDAHAHGVDAEPPKKTPTPPRRGESKQGGAGAGNIKALPNGTIINGRYKVEKLIGHGGMGTVYAVAHTNTGEALALKLLHPALAENDAAVQRFRTEARAPVRINSDNVVRVVDADVCHELGGVPFMVMERLEGQDLRSELKRRGALPAGEAVLYLTQVARALDKAHVQGIIHRDLKPANMYVVKRDDGSPLVKVLDFGIAKLTDDAARELTVAGQVFGTPWYMAPEQARGDLQSVGHTTDLWALGLIAYQLLSGRNYWTADGMAALVGQICYEPMTPPTQTAPHLGPLFDMWFARACNRDPSQRFQSAKEMVDEMAQALGVNQTGSNISTGDSALQINVQGMLQTGQQPHMAQLAAQGQGGYPAAPGAATIPGTRNPMEATDAPFSATHSPVGARKSGSGAAILIGVVVALLLVGGGAGIYFVLPGGAQGGTNQGSAAQGSATQGAASTTASASAAADGSGSAGDDDPGGEAKGDDDPGDEAKTDEDPGDEAKTDEDPGDEAKGDDKPGATATTQPTAAGPMPTAAAAKPTASSAGATPVRELLGKKPASEPAPPPPPKAAPKVDDVQF
jgi:serine/threonine-protein kinase